ncbi:MAG: co-chaperone GroES family protein [Candidatus Saccharimonadales bacterium]
MSVPIQPMSDYVVVQAEKAATKTASGLYIPGGAQEKPKSAKVVAVGSDVDEVKVGENIIYKNDYEATTVKIDKEDYVIVYKKNIIAVVK